QVLTLGRAPVGGRQALLRYGRRRRLGLRSRKRDDAAEQSRNGRVEQRRRTGLRQRNTVHRNRLDALRHSGPEMNRRRFLRWLLCGTSCQLVLQAAATQAQSRRPRTDVLFVPTPDDIVEKMLELAK